MHQRMFPSLQVDTEAELKRYEEYAKQLKPLVIETVYYINNELKKGKRILVEGANAAMLDIDFGKQPTPNSFSMNLVLGHSVRE